MAKIPKGYRKTKSARFEKKRGSGWFNESKRHSLASRGIKTAQKIPRTSLYSKGTRSSWKKVYESPKLIKYFDGKMDIELYPAQINDRRFWFIAVVSDTSIKDKEFESKSEAFDYLEKNYGIKRHSDFQVDVKLTNKDKKILKELQNDSRQTFTSLSRKINVPVHEIFDRLKNIEKNYRFVAIRKNKSPVPEKLKPIADFLEDDSRTSLTKISKEIKKPISDIYDAVYELSGYYAYTVEKKR